MIHRYGAVDSTLDVLHGLAAQGAPHGTVVVADTQLAGRGARGRAWHSPGGGLWYSILLRPGPVEALEVLSLRVGLSLARTLERRSGLPRVGLKWPNDLVLEDRKLGGILCEARWLGGAAAWVAVACGINVTNPLPDELRAAAITLGEAVPGIRAEALVEPVTEALLAAGTARGPLSPAELGDFAARDWLKGRRLVEPLAGIADGVLPDASLRVLDDAGLSRTARAGHVVLG